MKKTHDYVYCYRGYGSDGGKCRIRIYREDGRAPGFQKIRRMPT